MKPKKLLPLMFILFCGCMPGLKTIYEKVQTPGSGFMYVVNIYSAQDEMNMLKGSLDQQSNDYLRVLIRNQLDSLTEDIPYLRIYTVRDLYAKKAPNPPAPPPPPPFDPVRFRKLKYIAFFTRGTENKVELYKNGELLSVLKGRKLTEMPNTCIVRVPKGLSVKEGDQLTFKMPVNYLDNDGFMQERRVEYNLVNREAE